MHLIQHLLFVAGGQLGLQLISFVEMILDGAFVAPRNEYHLRDSCRDRLLHGILDQGFIHHR